MKEIKSLLIANRGEIACRIIRTARKMGIKTYAIYCDLDEHARFAEMADVKIPLGGTLADDTYLNTEKIVAIAKQYKIDAIHPGYGFLSENVEFARLLEKENICFVGPSAYSMDVMGDKLKAKTMAMQAIVPIVPSSKGLITNVDQAVVEAKKIGFPVMFKAVAGGGGKGIRIVWKESEIKEQFETAKYEAKTLYKNDDILLEKYVENPRHIEIQIVADKFGNVVCLGERECSIQRFNQKVIEESPSPFIDNKTRQKMYDCAVRLVKQCKYYSAGTLEFIMDANKNFYFLEMNTRLQVEHPVTEYVTGLDLVKLMIEVAEEKPLQITNENGKVVPLTQKNVTLRGHAIECRICAENPAKGFIPSNGRILHYIEPETDINGNVRIESGYQLGDEISPYYDSMIAKLITYGNTRSEAIETMKNALGEYEIGGIETNVNLLESIMRQPDFENGNISTLFIKNHYPHGFNALPLTDNTKKAFIASAVALYIQENEYNFASHKTSLMPRDTTISRLYVLVDDEAFFVSVIQSDSNFLEIEYNGEDISIKFNYQRGNAYFRSAINGVGNFSIRLKRDGIGYIMQGSGLVAKVCVYSQETYELSKYMPPKLSESQPQFLLSPITGKITKLKVAVGDKVLAGQHLLSIEAMKIDNTILAECDATIANITCKVSDNVQTDEKLIEFAYKK